MIKLNGILNQRNGRQSCGTIKLPGTHRLRIRFIQLNRMFGQLRNHKLGNGPVKSGHSQLSLRNQIKITINHRLINLPVINSRINMNSTTIVCMAEKKIVPQLHMQIQLKIEILKLSSEKS